MPVDTTATFAAVFATLYAAHQVADHWVQTDHQAQTKGGSGWVARINCAAHVATYTATAIGALVLLVAAVDVTIAATDATLGLAVSAVTHYIADRRTPLRWLADHTGSGAFYRLAGHGLNGSYALDQSWHVGWLFIAALIIA